MTDTPNATRCYICGHGNEHSLEEHHIVPRRFNGSDQPENLVHLCGSCHNAIESLYDDDFYRRLGLAVEGDGGDDLRVDSTGTAVSASESKDRKIPAGSPHVTFEEWKASVTVADLESGDYRWKLTAEDVVEYLDENRETLLERYEDELEEAKVIDESYSKDAEDFEPREVPPVSFNAEHGELATLPYILVTNLEKRDKAPLHEVEDVDAEADGGEGAEIKSVSEVDEESRLRWGEREETRPNYHRIHCGYCATVFTDNQHADAARHLRVVHGIENPYTDVDTTFHDLETPEEMHQGSTPFTANDDSE